MYLACSWEIDKSYNGHDSGSNSNTSPFPITMPHMFSNLNYKVHLIYTEDSLSTWRQAGQESWITDNWMLPTLVLISEDIGWIAPSVIDCHEEWQKTVCWYTTELLKAPSLCPWRLMLLWLFSVSFNHTMPWCVCEPYLTWIATLVLKCYTLDVGYNSTFNKCHKGSCPLSSPPSWSITDWLGLFLMEKMTQAYFNKTI